MATDAYDANFPESQSDDDKASARIEAEFDGLNGARQRAQSATEELCDLAKALISRERSLPKAVFDQAERFKRLDPIDLIDELKHFAECAYIGAESVVFPRARDGLQAVLDHIILGLDTLSENLSPERAEGELA